MVSVETTQNTKQKTQGHQIRGICGYPCDWSATEMFRENPLRNWYNSILGMQF